jgi:hypothetical protein
MSVGYSKSTGRYLSMFARATKKFTPTGAEPAAMPEICATP